MYENTLTNWSYKKYSMYRSCPFSVYLKYVKRVPEPPQDPKYDEKRQRGIKAHEDLEATINHGAPIPKIALPFEEIITGYIELGAVAEGDEFFDRQWKPWPEWKGHWLVVKKDVVIRTPEFALVADWKTGRKHGNEVSHFDQMTLYAVSEYVINPGLPEYTVELQYLDQEDTWQHTFKPHELEKHWARFESDVQVMFSDTTFRPKPSVPVCRYCPYNRKNNTGACPVAAV